MTTYKEIFTRVFSKTLSRTGVDLLKKTSMFGQKRSVKSTTAKLYRLEDCQAIEPFFSERRLLNTTF